MGENLAQAVKLVILFLLALSLLGAGVWTYQGLGLTVGLAILIFGVGGVLYAGYNTYQLASSV